MAKIKRTPAVKNIPTVKRKAPGMAGIAGFVQEQTAGGAVTPPFREKNASRGAPDEAFFPGTKLLKPNIIRQSVRPVGASKDKEVDITNLPPKEVSRIRRENMVASLAAKKVEELEIIKEMQAENRKAELAPQLAALHEEAPPSPGFQELLADKPGQETLQTAQAVGKGVGAGAVAGVAAGAGAIKAGAALGTVVAPGLGTAIGAGVGAIVAFGTATHFLSLQEKQEIANANKVVMLGHIGIGDAKTMANQGNPLAVQEFKRAKADILLGHKKLVEKSEEKLHWFQSFRGQDELIRAQDLVNDLDRHEQEIEIALLNPNPAAITDYRIFYANQDND